MSWVDRLRPGIELTSPDGDVYEAKYIGDSESVDKKLGVFDYPNANGTRTQDLGLTSSRYTIRLYFDGEDNDIISNDFMLSLRQRGVWSVVHPVKGTLELQPVNAKKSNEPVTGGNVTQVDTSWIEPVSGAILPSTQQLADSIDQQIIETNIVAGEQYAANVLLDTARQQIINEQAIDQITLSASQELSDIAAQNDEISSFFDSILRSITDTLDSEPIDSLALAGQISQLLQTPALAIQNIEARVNQYINVADSIIQDLAQGITLEDRNAVASAELGLTSVIGGVASSVINGNLATRGEAVQFIEQITDLYNSTVVALDGAMDRFSGNEIDEQYFSQSQAYTDLTLLVSQVQDYLLTASFDLKTEQIIVLDRPRSPIEITVTEYGALGNDDENYEFFLTSNGLTGNDILLIPAGREVSIYV